MDSTDPVPLPSRRRFIGTTIATTAAIGVFSHQMFAAESAFATPLDQSPLPYAYDALEPAIDRMTMEIHYERHHAGYVSKLKAALQTLPEVQRASAEGLVSNLSQIPTASREAVRNNAGGHLNHTIYWSILAPPASSPFLPRSELGRVVRSTFGGREGFEEALKAAGMRVFGSGWVWLCTRADGTLYLATTANQDNPLMEGAGCEVGFPVLGLDVWEHAYYLHYQNARGSYLSALLDSLNWEEANRRYQIRSILTEIA